MIKKTHFIGIGGAGLSAIARILLESGESVSGSDRSYSPTHEELIALGARIFAMHDPANIEGATQIIRSSAIPDDNCEVLAARAQNIPIYKRSEFLPSLTQEKTVVAIAGTHGKTTTTAMTAWIFSSLGYDPSYIIGGISKNLMRNAHAGKGGFFIIEADEYDNMFLGLSPDTAVITNVDYDHPDCFPTRQDYLEGFTKFCENIRPDGHLIACMDDHGADEFTKTLISPGFSIHYYGLGDDAEYCATDLQNNALGGTTFNFSVTKFCMQKYRLGRVDLRVPGEHNVRNALAALAVCHQYNLFIPKAIAALSTFEGTQRRFDVRDSNNGIVVIDDYAHHPTEIKTTIKAVRERYSGKRIWTIWQPHTYSRIRAFYEDFLNAFSSADEVIVLEVFAAREQKNTFSAATIAQEIHHPHVHFCRTIDDANSFLNDSLRIGDVIITFSAGDGYKISETVVNYTIKDINSV